VQSPAAGERVLASVIKFLEGKLKRRVNRQKSAVAYLRERKFLAIGGRRAVAWALLR
jgi:RNA-directed DNA polymerase